MKFKSDSDHNLLPPNQVSMHLYNDVVFYVEMLPCVFLQNIYPWDFMVTGKKKMNCSTCFAIKRDVSNVASCSMYTWWTCIFTVIKIVKMYHGLGMQIIAIVWKIFVGFQWDCICTLSYNQIFLHLIFLQIWYCKRYGEITNSIILKICSCFQKLEYIASGRDTNGEELSIISNLKSQVDNRVRDIINNVIRVESNLEKTDSKLSTVETRMKKYAIKLSKLSRNLTSIQKLSSQIQALK